VLLFKLFPCDPRNAGKGRAPCSSAQSWRELPLSQIHWFDAVAAMPPTAHAAEIKLLGLVSLRIVLPSLLPQFERSSDHKVAVGYDTLGAITKRLVEGEAFDVAMVSPAQNEELQKQGKLPFGSRVEVAKVGFTVFVKKGTPRPDVGSVDVLKRTLLAAKSVVLGDPAAGGGAGVYTAGLMQRLGLAAEIKEWTRRNARCRCPEYRTLLRSGAQSHFASPHDDGRKRSEADITGHIYEHALV
jgi:ABC-type molybdate transport system substrate-binding protein